MKNETKTQEVDKPREQNAIMVCRECAVCKRMIKSSELASPQSTSQRSSTVFTSRKSAEENHSPLCKMRCSQNENIQPNNETLNN
jgi:hypothetical protein